MIPLEALHNHLRRVAMADLELTYAQTEPDDDGDICLSNEITPVYARLIIGPPPTVRLWAVAASGLKRSSRLLREVNEINAHQMHVKVVLSSDGQLAVASEVLAVSLEEGELEVLHRAVAATVEEIGLLVQLVHGEASVPEPCRPAEKP